MRGSRKFCQREFNSENIFFFGWRRVGGSIYHFKQVIIGPPAKHHLNGVLLVCLWRPNIEHGLVALWFFKWSGPVLLRNLIFLWFFRGPDCLAPPPSGSAHVILYPCYMGQLIRFWYSLHMCKTLVWTPMLWGWAGIQIKDLVGAFNYVNTCEIM